MTSLDVCMKAGSPLSCMHVLSLFGYLFKVMVRGVASFNCLRKMSIASRSSEHRWLINVYCMLSHPKIPSVYKFTVIIFWSFLFFCLASSCDR